MSKPLMCICIILALIVIATPVQAMTIKTLDIAVQTNQDAVVKFDYELNWLESTAVFANMVNPGDELKKALEANTGMEVDNVVVTDNAVQVTIRKFTTETINGNAVTMTTPGLSFIAAERILKEYWFAPLIAVDFSPDITQVRFPDQYTETFVNQVSIPSVTHTVTYE